MTLAQTAFLALATGGIALFWATLFCTWLYVEIADRRSGTGR